MALITQPLDLPGIETSTVRVLSIDDNELNLRVHRVLLERVAGITNIVTTSDPFAGLEFAFDDPRPHLAIVNGAMPGMDGPTLIAELRRREAAAGLPRLPVLISSGAGLHHEAGLAAGADATLEMPVENAELVGLLLRFVARLPRPGGVPPHPDWADPSDIWAVLDGWLADWAGHDACASSLEDRHGSLLEQALGHVARLHVRTALQHAATARLLPPFCANWALGQDEPDDLRAWVKLVFGALVERARLTQDLGPARAVAVAAERHATSLEAALRFGTGGRTRLRALAMAAAADGFLSPQEVFVILGRDHEAALRRVARLGANW